MEDLKKYVNYEDFGAIGDGEADDLEAIIAAHAYANEHNLPVKTKHDAHYYIGPAAKTAIIKTDVDWNTTRFTIDDRAVEDNKLPCFRVESSLEPVELKINKLTRDTKQLDIHPEHDCIVTVYNDNVMHFIRFGLNPSPGEAALDTFVLKKDGSIYGTIDWDHDTVTRVVAKPIDETPLTIKGGVFTTIANQHVSFYNYYSRGVDVHRSNVTVDGVIHYVCGELSHGAPYRGFICGINCAYFTVKNCRFTGHKIYITIGRANLPVPMGSYDLHANNVVDFHCSDCFITNEITDNTRWGVIATNFCKNIVIDNCTFSRLDAHMGVSGEYTIRNSRLGHQGLNAIGKGKLTVENTTLYGGSLISFRADYGSIWEGDVLVKNCKWIPACGRETKPVLFNLSNNGMHDFGYPCTMPTHIEIDGLEVQDTNTPADYEGMQLFADPDGSTWGKQKPIADPRPFPYKLSESLTISNMTCASGKPVFICDNPEAFKDTAIVVNGEKLN